MVLAAAQLGADRLLVLLSCGAEDRQPRERLRVLQDAVGGRLLLRAEPVEHADLERGVRPRRNQDQSGEDPSQLGTVEDDGHDLGAERVAAREQRQAVAAADFHEPLQIGGDPVGGLLAPEVFQRIDRHGRHPALRQVVDHRLVEARPAAITGDEQKESSGPLDQAEHQREADRFEVLLQVGVDRRRPPARGSGYLRLGSAGELQKPLIEGLAPLPCIAEAVPDAFEQGDVCPADAPGKGVRRLRGAGLVHGPLQDLPVAGDLLDRRELGPFLARVIGRPEGVVRAQRRHALQVGTEPQAQATREALAGGGEDSVDQRRAAGVADQGRPGVFGELQLLLQRLADHLELPGGIPARPLRQERRLAQGRIRQTRDHRRNVSGRSPSHVHHSLAPAAVAADEQDGPIGRVGRNVNGRFADDRQSHPALLDSLGDCRRRGDGVLERSVQDEGDRERYGNHDVPLFG